MKTKYLLRIITLAMASITVMFFLLAAKPSMNQQIFIFSYFRFSSIVFLAILFVYFIFSLYWTSLLRVNAWSFYSVTVALVATEILLRAFVDYLPAGLMRHLPNYVRTEIAGDQGYFTNETLGGEGMLHRYKPHLHIPGLPWVKIDARGYRNPEDRLSGPVDVVFLGDSVTIAQVARTDFAHHFRKNGYTAVNLAMNGYGAYHYRDTFKKFVVDAALEPKTLIVVVTGYNDLSDTVLYWNTKESGGDMRNYLGSAPGFSFGNFQSPLVPWVISIIGNAMPTIKAMMEKRGLPDQGQIVFEYTSVSVQRGELSTESVNQNDHIWRLFETAMTELFGMAKDLGTRVLVMYFPPTRTIVEPYFTDAQDFRQQIRADNRGMSRSVLKFGRQASPV
jgi:hypothetical protein